MSCIAMALKISLIQTAILIVLASSGVYCQKQAHAQCPFDLNSIACTCYAQETLICIGNRTSVLPHPVSAIMEGVKKWTNGSVLYLFLSINNLQKIKPGSFLGTSVKGLFLSQDGLQKIPQFTFDGLQHSLEELDLGANNLSVIPNDALQDLKRLTVLKLSFNFISVVSRNGTQGLNQIKELDLSHNEINGIEPGGFEPMKELGALNLAGNLLDSLNPTAFDGLANLEMLDLSSNAFTFLNLQWLSNFPKLTELDVDSNHILSMNSVQVSSTSLQMLSLEKNKISSCYVNKSLDTPFLQILDLDFNELSVLKENCFGDLSSLKELDLSYNKIHEVMPKAFVQLENLQVLDLGHNGIIDFGPNSLGSISKIEELKLDNNPLSNMDLDSGLEKMDNMRIFSARSCDLKSLNAAGLPLTGPSEKILVQDNPLECDCTMAKLVEKALSIGATINGTCGSPKNLRGQSLEKINFYSLHCAKIETSSLVSQPNAYIKSLTNITKITLSGTAIIFWAYKRPSNNFTSALLSYCELKYWQDPFVTIDIQIPCLKMESAKFETILVDVKVGQYTVCLSIPYINHTDNSTSALNQCHSLDVVEQATMSSPHKEITPGKSLSQVKEKTLQFDVDFNKSSTFIVPGFNMSLISSSKIQVIWAANNWKSLPGVTCRLLILTEVSIGKYEDKHNQVINCSGGYKTVNARKLMKEGKHVAACIKVMQNFVQQNERCLKLKSSSPHTVPHKDKSHFSNLSIVLPIVIVVIFVIALIAIIALLFKKLKKRSRTENDLIVVNEETVLIDKGQGPDDRASSKAGLFFDKTKDDMTQKRREFITGLGSKNLEVAQENTVIQEAEKEVEVLETKRADESDSFIQGVLDRIDEKQEELARGIHDHKDDLKDRIEDTIAENVEKSENAQSSLEQAIDSGLLKTGDEIGKVGNVLGAEGGICQTCQKRMEGLNEKAGDP